MKSRRVYNILFSLILFLAALPSLANGRKAVVCRNKAGIPVLAQLVPTGFALAAEDAILSQFSLSLGLLGPVISPQCSVEWVTEEVKKLAIEIPSAESHGFSKGTLGHPGQS